MVQRFKRTVQKCFLNLVILGLDCIHQHEEELQPDIAENYLSKYWLSKSEYETEVKEIQAKIFNSQVRKFQDFVFLKSFETVALRGGILFEEEDFNILKECFRETGDKYIYIIENDFGLPPETPPFRMKYSSNINWKELVSGNFISTVLFNWPSKEYYVFGDTGLWGKYSANEYKNPLDIIGFDKSYSGLFKGKFEQPPEEKEEISEWLPPAYKH